MRHAELGAGTAVQDLLCPSARQQTQVPASSNPVLRAQPSGKRAQWSWSGELCLQCCCCKSASTVMRPCAGTYANLPCMPLLSRPCSCSLHRVKNLHTPKSCSRCVGHDEHNQQPFAELESTSHPALQALAATFKSHLKVTLTVRLGRSSSCQRFNQHWSLLATIGCSMNSHMLPCLCHMQCRLPPC